MEFCSFLVLTGLNKGKSVQVAVIRSQENITLYVNNKNQTIAANMSLLSEYNNKPWLNQEKGKYINANN